MTNVRNTIAVLAADAAAVLLSLWLLPGLSRQFQDLSFINSVVMGLFFLIFCFSVYGLKKLKTLPAGARLPTVLFKERLLGALGVIFALTISIATGYVVGFLDSVVAINRGLLDEPSVALYLLLTPASWFGLALLYVLVLTSETEAGTRPSTMRYWLTLFAGLLGVNLMGLAFVAVWQAVWARFNTVEAGLGALLLYTLLYLVLLGPPRLISLARTRQRAPAASFLLLIVYLAVLSSP